MSGKWQKGQSGNPKGRPKGFQNLARHIQAETKDGAELVTFALALFRGEPVGASGLVPKLELRWEALQWLADRGFGKPVQPIDLNVEEGQQHLDLSGATEEELAALEKFANRRTELLAAAVIDVPSE